jgi:parvulin-like peptidyl-prolyl isomerase
MRSLYVSAAHILVTHQESQPFGFLAHVVPFPRTKADAEARARRLHRELMRDPARFAELAARESDDSSTADLGGSLGTLRPLNVVQPIADALGYLKPGEISRIVETATGFHILRRLPVAEDRPLSLSHIVIKHEEASGWRRLDRPIPTRSKQEAHELATQVAAQVAADPRRFAELVRIYSDDEDAARDGDMGQFGRYEDVGQDFVMFERASRLAVGAVSGALETSVGFQIVQRTADREREELAASVITLPYQGAQIERFVPTRSTKEKAERIARRVALELRAHPERFAQRRIDYCDTAHCDGPFAWRSGRDMAVLEAALSRLAIGETLGEPVDTPLGYLVIRREPPTAVSKTVSAPIFEYPGPGSDPQPSADGAPPDPVKLVRSLTEYAVAHMKLTRTRQSRLAALFGELNQRMEAEQQRGGDFVSHMRWADEQVLALLGEEGFDEYELQRRRWTAANAL